MLQYRYYFKPNRSIARLMPDAMPRIAGKAGRQLVLCWHIALYIQLTHLLLIFKGWSSTVSQSSSGRFSLHHVWEFVQHPCSGHHVDMWQSCSSLQNPQLDCLLSAHWEITTDHIEDCMSLLLALQRSWKWFTGHYHVVMSYIRIRDCFIAQKTCQLLA